MYLRICRKKILFPNFFRLFSFPRTIIYLLSSYLLVSVACLSVSKVRSRTSYPTSRGAGTCTSLSGFSIAVTAHQCFFRPIFFVIMNKFRHNLEQILRTLGLYKYQREQCGLELCKTNSSAPSQITLFTSSSPSMGKIFHKIDQFFQIMVIGPYWDIQK